MKTHQVTTEAQQSPEEAERIQEFLIGGLTLGELEGIPKADQHAMAKTGFQLLEQGKLDAAREVFTGLLSLDPYDAYFHGALGVVAQQAGKPKDAEAHLDRSIELNGYAPFAWVHRAEARITLGRIADAAADLVRAVELDPKGEDPAAHRAQAILQALSEAD